MSKSASASSSFAGTTSPGHRLAQGNPAAITQLNVIAERTSATKERARAHFAKYQETWVVKEAADLWKRRAGLSTHVAALPAMAKEYTGASLLTEARRNVRARMTQRLTKINSVGTRMSNSVIRNLQSMQPGQTRTADHSPSRKGPSQ